MLAIFTTNGQIAVNMIWVAYKAWLENVFSTIFDPRFLLMSWTQCLSIFIFVQTVRANIKILKQFSFMVITLFWKGPTTYSPESVWVAWFWSFLADINKNAVNSWKNRDSWQGLHSNKNIFNFTFFDLKRRFCRQ